MKKTMFITSVIMVVVMAIALTTSSLAWFTAAGATSVTTAAFQVTAKSETVAGLAISNNGTSWSSSIDLQTTAGYTGSQLNPLVPYTKESHYVVDPENSEQYIWDFDEEDFLTALLGGDEIINAGTQQEDTIPYAAFMIGNKLGNNNTFTNDVYRAGWYEDTFYITNTANGSEAEAVRLNCTIAFYLPDGLTSYTKQNRDSSVKLYDLDATLNVAVLYATNRFDADGAEPYTTDDGWALLAFAKSKNGGTVNLGRAEANFAAGQNASSSYGPYTYNTNLGDGTRYTANNANTAIRPARSYDGEPVAADKMQIRVIAWYDGADLINNNAANANLQFGLTFGKTAYTPAP